MLFASVALVGAFGVGASNTMKGLVASMSDVTRKSIAEEKMMGGARLAVQSATALQTHSGDCDLDSMIEPLPFRSAGAAPHPAGGGYIPLDIGATLTDPWGTAYGYCVWDPGTAVAHAGCGGAGANRLAGSTTTSTNYPVVAVISAGKDRIFSTTCNAFVDTSPADGNPDTPLIVRANGGDDIVLEYTYSDANGLSGDDLWRVKDTSPGIAAIDKNIAVTGGAAITGAVELMEKGLVLPADPGDDSVTGPCTALNDQELRVNAGASPPILEICYDNDWVPISMGDSGGESCGTSWTLQPASIYASGIAYGNGTFVATGGGDISISSDGISWTTATAPAGFDNPADVIFANGQFLAVSLDGTVRVASSPDGINWTARTAAEPNSWAMLAYGNGLYLSVAWDGTNRVMTSPDGINWTAHSAPNEDWRNISYGNGRFVVNGVGQSMTSTDGITWTHYTGNNSGWGKSIFADGRFISTANGYTSSSVNGSTWTPSPTPDGEWYGIEYVPGHNLFVSVGYSGDERVMTSTDGINWTPQTPPLVTNWNIVRYGEERLVAVSGNAEVMTSECVGGNGNGDEEEEDIPAFIPSAIAQYQLDETTGTAIADSAGGAAGTLSGTTMPASVVGRSGRGIVFDGTNDRILIGTNPTVNSLTAMTISGWMRRDAGTGTETIYTNRNTGSNGITVQVNATLGQLVFEAGSGGAWSADIGYTLGNWTHFAITYDASNLSALPTFYANGVSVPLISVAQPSAFTAGGAGASIASNYAGSGSFFSGALDDVRIYGLMLASSQITMLYNDRPINNSISPNPSVILAANKYRGKISGGGSTGCAIKADGSLWCWGEDGYGQLGNGTPLSMQNLPQRTETQTHSNNFVQVGVGEAYACAIKADGSGWCWGHDGQGRLGNGAVLTADQPNPSPINSTGTWTQISTGLSHACGIQVDGSLWCWGHDAYGELSTGGGDEHSPDLVTEPGPWAYVAAGDYATCAIKIDGSLWCWGNNGHGLLGRGILEIPGFNAGSPAQVVEPGPWVHVGRPGDSVCAVKLDGTAWCWGLNDQGQLGNGTISGGQSVPQRVVDPGPWLEIATSYEYPAHCGIKIDGTAWCWGGNHAGILGIGSEIDTNYPTPTQVADPGPWATIEMSRFAGHGIKADGSGWSWGLNYNGGLGINQSFTGSTSYPRPIDTFYNPPLFTYNAAQTVLTKNAAANTISLGTNSRLAYDATSGGFGYTGSGRSYLTNPLGNSILNITAAGAYDSQITFDAQTGNNEPSIGIDNVTGNLEIVSKTGTNAWMSAITPHIEITSTGNVGVGTSGTPAAKLDITGGAVRIGNDTRTCTPSRKGVLRYTGTTLQYCNGALWKGLQ